MQNQLWVSAAELPTLEICAALESRDIPVKESVSVCTTWRDAEPVEPVEAVRSTPDGNLEMDGTRPNGFV